jgi:hypothetical protein
VLNMLHAMTTKALDRFFVLIERKHVLLVQFPDQRGKSPQQKVQADESQHHAPSVTQESQRISEAIAKNANRLPQG